MRRGFKADAERRSASLRDRLELGPDEPLDLRRAASELGVPVRSMEDFVPRSRLEELEAIQSDAFSAGTFQVPSGGYVIVYNPLHHRTRIRSDIAHELAHLLLEHQTRALERVGDLGFFTCSPEQEEEANWLAACLLVPRDGVLQAARRGSSPAAVARRYEVSEPMARFRLNATGAAVQARRGRRAASGR